MLLLILKTLKKTFEGFVEKSLIDTKPLDHYQFVRNGYYVTDYETKGNKLVFNQTVSLKSSFSK